MAYFLLLFNYGFPLAFKQYGAICLKHYDSSDARPKTIKAISFKKCMRSRLLTLNSVLFPGAHMKNNIYENSTLAYVEFLGP